MACGLPVVSSDKGGLKEVVGGAALIIDPYDARDIAEGIKHVLEDRAIREELIHKGLERAKKFSCIKMAEEIYQVYQEIYHSN